MIIELLDKLIGRSVELVKERQIRTRLIFDDFVVPLMQCFEEVHATYRDTFRKAREIARQEDNPFPQLRTLMYEDSLFTWDQRVKLISLARSTKPTILAEFVSSIERYLGVPLSITYSETLPEAVKEEEERERGILSARVLQQGIRFTILSSILGRGFGEDKGESLEAIEQCLAKLQSHYSAVELEYGKLKNKLLVQDL